MPRQLPTAVADFTGRAAELAALTRILDDADAVTAGTVAISAIAGTAGVGKTALALHWAHGAADRFADGQLYVDLRGFTPSGIPATPEAALRGFLDALGVPAQRIPRDPDAQAALYRSLLADRKMLIVLDNARDEQQVRPLLPASSGSLVIVTSRSQLAGLAAAYGARLLSLDVLPHGEAVQMLTARIGPGRANAEPTAVAETAALCARLPLALAVAGARAAARPSFPLTALAAELRDGASRLDALDIGDPSASVRTVFSWSYQQLGDESARMFRLLGLHPGPDITAQAAASLAATSEPEAQRLLRELTRDCLIAEHIPGRYGCHDLLRAYAAARARDCDSEPDRAAATSRLLDHYLHTAHTAALTMFPWRTPMTLVPPSRGTVPESLADDRQALAWFEAERDVLFAAVALAAGSGFDRHAWQLPWALWEYLQRRGQWHERVSILGTGLAAAIHAGDIAGQAASCRLLALAYFWVGDYGQADAYVRHSMELYQRLGDRFGEANVHAVLAFISEGQGCYADAIDRSEEALNLFRAVGYPAGEAQILNNIGWYHALLGDYQQARAFCHSALTLSAELGYRYNEGNAWDSLGYTEHRLGNFTEAVACYQRALGIFREFGNRFKEAATLSNLGDTRHADGELPRAREAWQQALAILEDIDHPNAGEVRAKLASTQK